MTWDLHTMEKLNQHAVDIALQDKMIDIVKNMSERKVNANEILSKSNQEYAEAIAQHIVAIIFEQVGTIMKIVDLEVGKRLNEDNYQRAAKIAEDIRYAVSEGKINDK